MDSSLHVFDTIQAIQIESPVSKIIRQLKQLIISGQLKPGHRLPSERLLAERFGVGRSYVREAIMKLEFYGLLKTSPQSGTFVSGYNIKILDSVFSDIINFNKDDLAALIEARYHMEITAVQLAAIRRSDNDIKAMEEALEDFDDKVTKGMEAVEEDMLFHIKIAGAGKNSVVESMILTTIPDVIRNIREHELCGKDSHKVAMGSHHKILDAIVKQNAKAAGNAMADHLAQMLKISQIEYAKRSQ
ncbi:MAG: FadR/GntR family transcriptional regulator [Ginsengibacter sp.]